MTEQTLRMPRSERNYRAKVFPSDRLETVKRLIERSSAQPGWAQT